MLKMNHPEEDENGSSYLECIPSELVCRIVDYLDLKDVCSFTQTSKSLNEVVKKHNAMWRRHYLSMKTVCPLDVEQDQKDGYTWKETLQRLYQKSKVKKDWLAGRYSNVRSYSDLPDGGMCPMKAEDWGDIVKAEHER
uniref:F-box domain-containing protein n=1 Tax=Leptobrachium leishanense TaxID=445787 RepID=A0A8C5MCB1_9ANUR